MKRDAINMDKPNCLEANTGKCHELQICEWASYWIREKQTGSRSSRVQQGCRNQVRGVHCKAEKGSEGVLWLHPVEDHPEQSIRKDRKLAWRLRNWQKRKSWKASEVHLSIWGKPVSPGQPLSALTEINVMLNVKRPGCKANLSVQDRTKSIR